MGSIPVANPSPPRRWRFSRRVIPLAFLAVASVALLVVALMVVWPPEDDPIVGAGQVEDLETEVPVRHDNFYVVKLESGEVIALSQTDPHPVFGKNPDCLITWRSDFVFQESTGWFRGTCSGSTFDVTGTLVFGPSPRWMDRYEIDIRGDGSVVVDTSERLCAPDYTTASCP